MAPLLRAVVAFVLAFASFSSVCAQNVPIPLVCQTGVQVIAVVGTNVTNGTQSFGLTVTFVQHVMAAIPGSSNFSVNYNRFPPGKETGGEIVKEVTEGQVAFIAALQNYTAACPNTPIVIHGYSEGGMVVMNSLCGASSMYFEPTKPMSSTYASNIIAVILYGEETRTANQPYDLGGCNASAPYFARSNPAGCNAFAPTMQSYCFANDVDCCSTANASAPYPYGIKPHYLYPAGFDQDATNFIVTQYNAYRSRHGGATTTTSASVTGSKTSSSSSSIKTTSSSSTSKPSSSSSSTRPTSASSTSRPSSTSSLSRSSSLTTLITTTGNALNARPTKTPLTIQPSCAASPDSCLEIFAAHPTIAARFCNHLSAGIASASPFPRMCRGNYTSRVSSACGCLVLPTAVANASSTTA